MSPNHTAAAAADGRALTDWLDAIDRAGSTKARIQVAANLLFELGFERVLITLRDASMNATMATTAGASSQSSNSGFGLKSLPGAVWRRRLVQLERFRVDDLFLLDGSDPWVAREFFGVPPAVRAADESWLSTDLIIVYLRGADQEVVGTVKLAGPRDGRRPSEARRRDISVIARHLSARIAYDALRELAEQRHTRLQRLQEAGASFTRSLDEFEIIRELVRQVSRAVRGDGVAVLVPDLDKDVLTTAHRVVRGVERVRAPVRLGDGVIAEVARTGQPVRVGDREADRAREKAGLVPPLSMYDIVGESGTATSVLAVPVRVGIRLIAVLAVHSSSADMYTAEDEELLATMASQAATAIANARRYAESERERRTTEALADVACAVGESLRLGEVLRLILRHAVSLLGVEGACIALRNDDYMHIVAAVGAADVLAGLHLPVHNSLLGRVVRSNQCVVVNDLRDDPEEIRAMQRLAPITRAVIAPLITGRGTIGSIGIINRALPFAPDDAKVLQRLADQVAVAIVNARLFEEVERATREWKVAFDSSASGMVVLEEALTVSRCNTRAAELCRTSVSQLIGKRFRDVLLGAGASPEAGVVDRLIERALNEGEPARDIVRDDSSGRLLSLLAAPHPDGGCVITFDDVTETHRLAERHRTVLETVSDAIVITGLDGRVTFANPAAHQLFGREILVNELTVSITAVAFRHEVLEHEQMALAGVNQHYRCEVLCADGARDVEVSSAPLYELGKIIGTVACLRDVTAQEANADARARADAMYTRLVEAAADAIFTVDANGIFTMVNASLLKEAALERHQVLGQHYLMLIDPVDREMANRIMAETLAGERRRTRVRCIGRRGESRLTMATTTPIHENGVLVGALGIVRDITNEEILRESSVQHARMAAIGAVLSRVANEFNNPLSTLMAVAELQVASPTLAAADRCAIEEIRTQAQRASTIVGQLLEMTGDGPAGVTLDAPVDVNGLVTSALELHATSLAAHDVQVRCELAHDELLVAGDGLRLQQALSHLLLNAEEALREHLGVRRLRVSTHAGRDGVEVRVSDTGPGVPQQHVARIFEPMFTTRGASGQQGLGLTISSAIARDHGGRLEVLSSCEAGATFVLSLPNAGDVTGVLPDPTERAATGRPCQVLLIEDEAALRTAISRYLRNSGYVVDLAADGSAALDRLRAQAYDVVLLDLRTRGLSGEEVYDAIASLYPEQSRRVLFMTGDLHSADAARFIRRTGRPVIAKPFALADLDTRVRQLLG